MIERLNQFIDSLGISVRAFEQHISASNGVIRKAITNKTDIQSKWLAKIADNYPQLNITWLLTGNGSMVVEPKAIANNNEIIGVAIPSKIGIPLIPIDAMAGFMSGNSTSIMEHECERYSVPLFRGAEFLIPVKGSSMQPKYNSGDLVACSKIPLDTFFLWHKVYVIDTEQGVLIKRVERASDDEHILLVSDNPAYSPVELHKSHIHSLASVIGVIRLE